jgi:hypothetical protein
MSTYSGEFFLLTCFLSFHLPFFAIKRQANGFIVPSSPIESSSVECFKSLLTEFLNKEILSKISINGFGFIPDG